MPGSPRADRLPHRAHCVEGADAARVWFDEGRGREPGVLRPGDSSYEGTRAVHPGYQLFVGGGLPGFVRRDVALVQLSEPVPTSVVARYAVLPQAGVVDGLANKTAVDLVGYGASVRSTGGSRPVWDGWSGRASTDDG